MEKRNKGQQPKLEKRQIKVELRAASDDDSRKIEGYACVFDSASNKLGYFKEVIAPDAFDGADLSDVRCLVDHNPSKILARTSSGTLVLEIDKKGLKYTVEDMPDTTVGNDTLISIKRGDINQSSFAFTVSDEKWSEEKVDGKWIYTREILKFDKIYDVSPVTYPAYEDTTVAVRSFENFKKEREEMPFEVQKQLRSRRFFINKISK